MSSAAFKSADSKAEEYRKYLAKAGVVDSLTKVLVALYEEPEKPENALDFLRHHLHGGPPQTAEIEDLKLENSQLKEQNEKLVEEVAELKQKLDELTQQQQNQAAAK